MNDEVNQAEDKELVWSYKYSPRAFGSFVSIWFGDTVMGSITVYQESHKEALIAKLRAGGFVEYNEGEGKRD